MLKQRQASLVGLLKNKIPENKLNDIVNRFNMGWDFTFNKNQHNKSRILVLWDADIWSISVIHKNEQYITTLVWNKVGLTFYCTLVYPHNQSDKRIELWE